MSQTYVGIDVSKHRFDVAPGVAPKRTTAWPTTLRPLRLAASTWPIWHPTASWCQRSEAWSVPWPCPYRQLAKADRMGAPLLAEMAAQMRPPVRPLPDDDLQATGALVLRRT